MSSCILDASALLALFNREPGEEAILEAISEGGFVSTVNYAEVVSKVVELDLDPKQLEELMVSLELELIDFVPEDATNTGLLREVTRRFGLSLGDRACLAVAKRLGLPVLTSDKAWAGVDANLEIRMFR